MDRAHFILYVDDAERSRDFYAAVLGRGPTLDVPGMTEFELPGGAILGLMPAAGICRLLGPGLPDPRSAGDVPRAELYLVGDQAEKMLARALKAGARLVSAFEARDWGHSAAYCLDPDGHVVALARDEGEVNSDVPALDIRTERLLLRPFAMTDAGEVQRLAGDRRVAVMTARIPHPYDDGMAEAWIEGHAREHRRGTTFTWAVTRAADGALLGAVSLMDVNRGAALAEMGYWIGVEYWNQGFATEAARAVINWAFSELGLNRVYAHHMSRNPASGSVLIKAGMRHEGSQRQHFCRGDGPEDIELYGIVRADWASGRQR